MVARLRRDREEKLSISFSFDAKSTQTHPPVAHLSSFKTQIQVACWSNIWSKQAHHQRICTFFGTAGGFSFSQAVVFALRGVVLEQQSLPFTAIRRPSYQVQGWSPGALGCLFASQHIHPWTCLAGACYKNPVTHPLSKASQCVHHQTKYSQSTAVAYSASTGGGGGAATLATRIQTFFSCQRKAGRQNWLRQMPVDRGRNFIQQI